MSRIRKKSRLLIATLLIVVTSAGIVLGLHATKANSPTQNKQIEIQAFKAKDASLCNTIKGKSYYFGGADEQISTSQTQARKLCKENITNDTEPYLIGI